MGKRGGFRRGGGGGAQNSALSSPGNGGIMGSGIFGMFGTTIRCDATDNSMYCSIMKFFNLFFMIFLVFFVLWVIYQFAYPLFKRGTRK